MLVLLIPLLNGHADVFSSETNGRPLVARILHTFLQVQVEILPRQLVGYCMTKSTRT